MEHFTWVITLIHWRTIRYWGGTLVVCYASAMKRVAMWSWCHISWNISDLYLTSIHLMGKRKESQVEKPKWARTRATFRLARPPAASTSRSVRTATLRQWPSGQLGQRTQVDTITPVSDLDPDSQPILGDLDIPVDSDTHADDDTTPPNAPSEKPKRKWKNTTSVLAILPSICYWFKSDQIDGMASISWYLSGRTPSSRWPWQLFGLDLVHLMQGCRWYIQMQRLLWIWVTMLYLHRQTPSWPSSASNWGPYDWVAKFSPDITHPFHSIGMGISSTKLHCQVWAFEFN